MGRLGSRFALLLAFCVVSPAVNRADATKTVAAPSASKDSEVVLAIFFGTKNAPFKQTIISVKPFQKPAVVERAVESIKQIDKCRYEIEASVASNDAMAGESGRWRYRLDLSKVGDIDAALAPNAYEALSWSPIMFLYPAQKETARHHLVSKVIRVALSTKDKFSYCGQNLTTSQPETCFAGKAFEISPSATTVRAIKENVSYLKSHVCPGVSDPARAGRILQFPVQGKFAPSDFQCRASNETDADDSITFKKNTIVSSDGPPCIAKSLSVDGGIVSSSESCGGHPLKRKTKIIDKDHIVFNFGDSQFAKNYMRCP